MCKALTLFPYLAQTDQGLLRLLPYPAVPSVQVRSDIGVYVYCSVLKGIQYNTVSKKIITKKKKKERKAIQVLVSLLSMV